MEILSKIVNSIIDVIGYDGILLLKDGVIFLMGFLSGYIIMLVRASLALRHLHTIRTMEENVVVKLKQGDRTVLFTNPKNWKESIQIAVALSIKPVLKGKTYTKRDKKRANIAIIVLVLIFTIITVTGVTLLSISILKNPNNGIYDIIKRWK